MRTPLRLFVEDYLGIFSSPASNICANFVLFSDSLLDISFLMCCEGEERRDSVILSYLSPFVTMKQVKNFHGEIRALCTSIEGKYADTTK